MDKMPRHDDAPRPPPQPCRFRDPSLISIPRLAISNPYSSFAPSASVTTTCSPPRSINAVNAASTHGLPSLVENHTPLAVLPPFSLLDNTPRLQLNRLAASAHILNRIQKRLPNQVSSASQIFPTPQATPPYSLTPPSRTSSNPSLSLPESFCTARESPWMSDDELKSLDASPNHQLGDANMMYSDCATGSRFQHTHLSSHLPDPNASLPRLSTPNSLQTPTLRQARVPKIAKLIDIDSQYARHSLQADAQTVIHQTAHHNLSYADPTLLHHSPLYSDKPNGRFSSLSMTSTIVEAIIISTPPSKPQKLRHVDKICSLRDPLKPKQLCILSTRRVMPSPRQSPPIPSLLNPFDLDGQLRDQTLGEASAINPPPRDHTDRLLRQHKDIESLHHHPDGEKGPQKVVGFCDDKTVPVSSASPKGLVLNRSYTSLPPASSSASSSAANSLVTVIKSPSARFSVIRETKIQSQVPEPSVSEHMYPVDQVHGITDVPLEDYLSVPVIERRPSNASGRSFDRLDIRRRTSTDRSTVRSEDQPRHLHPQWTPFSQFSDTQGSALEVSEAKAVNIYPHNNHSLLVVEQNGRPCRAETTCVEPLPVAQQEDTAFCDAKSTRLCTQPSTPPQIQLPILVDSPLKNPRIAPAPPIISVQPATPLSDKPESVVQLDACLSQRRTILQRARRYSDNLLQPLLIRSSSTKRKGRSQSSRQRDETRDANLHPSWHSRGFWHSLDDSDPEWEADEEAIERLPSGGDTSEPPPPSLPRRLTKRLPGFRASGGFLIGNSLNLERHGTNNHRHCIDSPSYFHNSKVVLRRDFHNRTSASGLQPNLRGTQSLSSLRSYELRQPHIRRRWNILGLNVRYVGLDIVRKRWQHKRLKREERKAEKRRDHIRRSIGPKFLIANSSL